MWRVGATIDLDPFFIVTADFFVVNATFLTGGVHASKIICTGFAIDLVNFCIRPEFPSSRCTLPKHQRESNHNRQMYRSSESYKMPQYASFYLPM